MAYGLKACSCHPLNLETPKSVIYEEYIGVESADRPSHKSSKVLFIIRELTLSEVISPIYIITFH